MKSLRELLHPYLKSIHLRVYFQDAPDNAQFPYLVYDFTQITNDGEGFETAAVDIDGWDMPADGDTTALETLMQTVNDALNKKTLLADEKLYGFYSPSQPFIVVEAPFAVTFYLDRKIPIRDDNPDIKRRKYIYEARLFGRG